MPGPRRWRQVSAARLWLQARVRKWDSPSKEEMMRILALTLAGLVAAQLFDLSDDMATKVDIQFYSDARDALLKAIAE